MTTILVVEDSRDQLETTSILFSHLGYNVIKASNGTAALEIVQNQQIDVLFTDFVMPGKIRSVDLVIETKKLHPRAVIIFASGYPMLDIDMITGTTTVFKPYNVLEVDHLIQDALKCLQISNDEI